MTEPASPPPPASMRGFLLLVAILAVLATTAFLVLGDSWSHWFPSAP